VEQVPRDVVVWFLAPCWMNYEQLIATAAKQNGFFIKDLKAD